MPKRRRKARSTKKKQVAVQFDRDPTSGWSRQRMSSASRSWPLRPEAAVPRSRAASAANRAPPNSVSLMNRGMRGTELGVAIAVADARGRSFPLNR